MHDVLRGKTHWGDMGADLGTAFVLGAADPHDQGAGHVVAEGSAGLANKRSGFLNSGDLLGRVHVSQYLLQRQSEEKQKEKQ